MKKIIAVAYKDSHGENFHIVGDTIDNGIYRDCVCTSLELVERGMAINGLLVHDMHPSYVIRATITGEDATFEMLIPAENVTQIDMVDEANANLWLGRMESMRNNMKSFAD